MGRVTKYNSASLSSRTRTDSRWFYQIVDPRSISTQVLSTSQSPGPVGSQYTVGTLTFKVADLSPNAIDWVQSYDAYRIKEVEITAFLSSNFTGSERQTLPVLHYCFEDLDTDDTVTTSWIRLRDRQNVNRVLLNRTTPCKVVARIKPRPTFKVSGQSQDPSNLVGTPSSWVDSLNTSQLYTGLRAFSYCPTADNQGQSYEYAVSYNIRVLVEVKAPI